MTENPITKAVENAVKEKVKGEFEKTRRYISDPDDAPDDVEVQEGARGGYYYDTDDLPGEDSEEEAEEEAGDTDSDDGGSPSSREELEEREEEYQERLDDMDAHMGSVLLPDEDLPDYMHEAFDEVMSEGSDGMVEGIQEALHGGFFDERYDSFEDVVSDMANYAGESPDEYLDGDDSGNLNGSSPDEVAGDVVDYLDEERVEDADRDALEDMVWEYITGHGDDPEDYGGLDEVVDAVEEETGGGSNNAEQVENDIAEVMVDEQLDEVVDQETADEMAEFVADNADLDDAASVEDALADFVVGEQLDEDIPQETTSQMAEEIAGGSTEDTPSVVEDQGWGPEWEEYEDNPQAREDLLMDAMEEEGWIEELYEEALMAPDEDPEDIIDPMLDAFDVPEGEAREFLTDSLEGMIAEEREYNEQLDDRPDPEEF